MMFSKAFAQSGGRVLDHAYNHGDNWIHLSLAVGLALSLASWSHADGSDFIPGELGLSADCAAQIAQASHDRCNEDSMAAEGDNREHECLESPQSSVKSDASDSADFEVAYTAGDADDYWYDVQVSDKAQCKFSFKAEQ